MNILYIAYSCDPYNGSEDKIGWNIPLESSKIGNKVIVITKKEQKNNIQKYCELNNFRNIEFIYVDINDFYKKIFKGPLYSGRLNIWHKKAFKIAKKVCSDNKIETIHQITPIEFRSIGKYGKILDSKFVVGPIGGGEYIPTSLKFYAKKKKKLEFIRRIVNRYYKIKLLISRKIKKCDYIFFANKETKDYLGIRENQNIIPEICIRDDELIKNNTKIQDKKQFTFLISGRIIYRKGHSFLLDVIEEIPPNLKYNVVVLGEGEELERLRARVNNSENLRQHVTFLGKISFEEIYNEYDKANVLIMPSLRETTGTVILEAMAREIPVITIDKFGAKTIINKTNGYLYYGNTQEEIIKNLKNIMIYCINNSNDVIKKGKKARKDAEKYTFKKRVKYYEKIYEKIK